MYFTKGYVIYVQLKDTNVGFLRQDKPVTYSYISRFWLAEGPKDAFICPTKDAALARKQSVESEFSKYIEYMIIMYFDGNDVTPLENEPDKGTDIFNF